MVVSRIPAELQVLSEVIVLELTITSFYYPTSIALWNLLPPECANVNVWCTISDQVLIDIVAEQFVYFSDVFAL